MHPLRSATLPHAGRRATSCTNTTAWAPKRSTSSGTCVREWAGRLETWTVPRRFRTAARFPGRTRSRSTSTASTTRLPRCPNGNLLTISNELRTVSGFSQGRCVENPRVSSPAPIKLITDVIFEFERRRPAGSSTSITLADYLHPQTNPGGREHLWVRRPEHLPELSCTRRMGDIHDWTACQRGDPRREGQPTPRLDPSPRHDPRDHLSRRRHSTPSAPSCGAWVRTAATSELTGNGEWQYHQHAIELEADGSLLMFDNGNDRPNTSPLYSRAVRYTINDAGPTVVVDGVTTMGVPTDDRPHPRVRVLRRRRQPSAPMATCLIDTGGMLPAIHGINAQIDEVVPAAQPTGGTVVFELRVPGVGSRSSTAPTRVPSLYGSAIPVTG